MIDILCFTYPDEAVAENTRLHNVSIAIGVLGRSTDFKLSIGTPAVSIDVQDNYNIFAAAHLTMGEAMKFDYWKEKTELFPFATKVHTIVPRMVIGTTNDIWYPRTTTGKLKSLSTICKDNSDFVQLVWEKLIKNLDQKDK